MKVRLERLMIREIHYGCGTHAQWFSIPSEIPLGIRQENVFYMVPFRYLFISAAVSIQTKLLRRYTKNDDTGRCKALILIDWK